MCYKSASTNFSWPPVYLQTGPRDSQEALWIGRCLNGDQLAFELLVRKYEQVLFRVALRLTGEYEDARDATQNTFVKAFEQLHRYDPGRKFFSWIYRIAVNECLNLRRTRRPQEPLADASDGGVGPFEAFARVETRHRIDQAMKGLTFEYREVIALRYFVELSYEEMAEAIGVPEKTVKSRLFSARQKLAGLLGVAGNTNDGE